MNLRTIAVTMLALNLITPFALFAQKGHHHHHHFMTKEDMNLLIMVLTKQSLKGIRKNVMTTIN